MAAATTLADADVDALIMRHRPRFWLHSQEAYFPMDVVEWFARCTVNDLESDAPLMPVDQPLTPALLDAAFVEPPAGRRATLKLRAEFNHVRRGTTALETVPVYARVIDSNQQKLYVTYIVFFAYNADYNVFLGARRGGHYADFERVNLQFDRATLTLERIYFGAHGSGAGRWVAAGDVRYVRGSERRRPVVYIARGSHALYSRPGTYVRFAGAANDLCRPGTRWEPLLIQRLVDRGEPGYAAERMGWLRYQGDMGFGRVDNLTYQAGIWSDPGGNTDEKAAGRSTADVRPDTVLAILLTTLAAAVVVFLAVMYAWWRQQSRQLERYAPADRRPSQQRYRSRLLHEMRSSSEQL